MFVFRRIAAVLGLFLLPACASLGALASIQPPHIEAAQGRQAEVRLLPPSTQRPSGSAAVRLWARVENPNPLGLTLASLQGGLSLDGRRAARVDFPLGLPLQAGQDTIVPLDVEIDFRDLPGLADVAAGALLGGAVPYRLDGTMAVDAGVLGRPGFGPLTLLEGNLRVRR